jgi:hypothetical protein
VRVRVYRARGEPLSEPQRVRVLGLVERFGESVAAQKLGIERRTLARVLAGLPLYPGTRALVGQRLEGADAT